ncbi:MAG: hypothetical protein O3A00_02025 [Planctomycetota bacterium]|nr:hypothetical protein [Planctomycetota bacterium]
MQLNSEQLQLLDAGRTVAIVVDGRDCFVVPRRVYETHERDLLDDWHPGTMQRQMAEVMSDDWNDPAMSVYDDE